MRLELAVGGGYGNWVVPRGDHESKEWAVMAELRQSMGVAAKGSVVEEGLCEDTCRFTDATCQHCMGWSRRLKPQRSRTFGWLLIAGHLPASSLPIRGTSHARRKSKCT